MHEVIEKKTSIRSIAKCFNIAKSHLARLVRQAKNTESFIYKPNVGNRRIFSTSQESSLTNYLKTSAKMWYGLTTIQIAELAYQYAVHLKNVVPSSWEANKKASSAWLKGFLGPVQISGSRQFAAARGA